MAYEGAECVRYAVQDRLGCALRGTRCERALRGWRGCQNRHLIISESNPLPAIVRKQQRPVFDLSGLVCHSSISIPNRPTARQSTLEKGVGQTTLEFKISLVRPITPETGLIKAEGVVLSRVRRVGTAEGRITDTQGRLLV